MRHWRRRHEPFDLEAELRASRPEPRSDYVSRLEGRVRDDGRYARTGSLRVAFVGALTALMLSALASVGGLGYAASTARDAAVSVKRAVAPNAPVVLKRSAAVDQYGKKKKVKKVKKKKKKGKGAAGVRARKRPPFTG